jgi:hypothetical protein
MHVQHFRFWLAVLAVGGMALAVAAAPAPAPKSQGPVSDFLRLRATLPAGEAPSVVEVSSDDETLTMTHRMVASVPTVRTQTVEIEIEGRRVSQVQTVTVMVPVVQYLRRKVPVKECKVFRVSKEGKLEAVEADKGAAQWKKPTEVLVGTSAEVDPRQLELIKPGTFYLVLSERAVRTMPWEAVAPVPRPPKAERLKK